MKLFRKIPRFSIGLDFGTTTSRLCYLDNTIRYQVPPKIHPLRSVVTPVPDDSPGHFAWYSGQMVLDNLWDHYSLVKLSIGRMEPLELKSKRTPDVTIAFRPEVVAAHLMWALYTKERTNRRDLSKCKDVTVTVPAEWNMIQRQATILAARMAGFNNVHLIEEPIAAFLAMNTYHPHDRLRSAKYTLVFDCGGGTLDVTVVHRPDQRAWPSITGRSRRKYLPYVCGRAMNKEILAGEKIDERLSEMVVEKDIWEEISLHDGDRRFFANIVRQLKETLNPQIRSQEPMAEARWPNAITLPVSKILFERGNVALTLETMRTVTDDIAEKAMGYVDSALQNAGITSDDVDAVIMVGGSSYLRSMQRCIEKKFEKLPWDAGIYLDQPEEIVALGAAMYQADLDQGQERFSLHLPMDTHLLCQEWVGDKLKWIERSLGKSKENTLPFGTSWPEPIIPIPKGLTEIRWSLRQSHSFSEDEPDVIEQVIFEDYSGQADKLRLKYLFDLNACLQEWEPSLILRDDQAITGSPRRYDWLTEQPDALAQRYGISNSTQWKVPSS